MPDPKVVPTRRYLIIHEDYSLFTMDELTAQEFEAIDHGYIDVVDMEERKRVLATAELEEIKRMED